MLVNFLFLPLKKLYRIYFSKYSVGFPSSVLSKVQMTGYSLVSTKAIGIYLVIVIVLNISYNNLFMCHFVLGKEGITYPKVQDGSVTFRMKMFY